MEDDLGEDAGLCEWERLIVERGRRRCRWMEEWYRHSEGDRVMGVETVDASCRCAS